MATRSPNLGLASGLRINYFNPNPNAEEAYEESNIALDEANENERWNQYLNGYNPDFVPRFPSSYKEINDLNGPGISYSDRSNAENMFTSNRLPTNNTDPVSNESGHNAFSNLMGTRGEGDPRSDARYQELLKRRDDIVAEIHRLTSEIAWQEKLKARNLTQDPLWEEAKYKWIYKGDDSGMKNIRDIEVKRRSDEEQRYWQAQENRKQREATENIAKMNRDETKAEKARAAEASARNAREYLDWIYKNYKTNPDNLEVIESLHSAMRKFEENAADAGKTAKDYMDAARIDEINAAIEAGLAQKAKNIKAGKIASGIEAEIKKAVETFNASSNRIATTQRKAKLNEFKNNPKYKNYVFGTKDDKIYYQKVGK